MENKTLLTTNDVISLISGARGSSWTLEWDKDAVAALLKGGSRGALHETVGCGSARAISTTQRAGCLVSGLNAFAGALGSLAETPNVRLCSDALLDAGGDQVAIETERIADGTLVAIDHATDCGKDFGVDGTIGTARGQCNTEDIRARSDGVRQLNRNATTLISLRRSKRDWQTRNRSRRETGAPLANIHRLDGCNFASSWPAPGNNLIGSSIIGTTSTGQSEGAKSALQLSSGANRSSRVDKGNRKQR